MSAAPTFTITAHPRTVTGKKVKQLRREGLLPAVLYGNVSENRALTLDAHSFGKQMKEIGFTTLVDLAIDGEKPLKVLVHDASYHPTRGEFVHVDFFAVNLKEKISTDIPLQFTGVAEAVDTLGGTLLTPKDTVEVECLPQDLPQHIAVDITVLKDFDTVIRVSDLQVPAGVTILDDAEDVLASVTEPISEEEFAALNETPAEDATTEFTTTSGTDKVEEPPKA